MDAVQQIEPLDKKVAENVKDFYILSQHFSMCSFYSLSDRVFFHISACYSITYLVHISLEFSQSFLPVYPLFYVSLFILSPVTYLFLFILLRCQVCDYDYYLKSQYRMKSIYCL